MYPEDQRLRLFCSGAAQINIYFPFIPDCSGGGNVTLTAQMTSDEIRVRKRDGRCAEQPDLWQLYISRSGRVTDHGQ